MSLLVFMRWRDFIKDTLTGQEKDEEEEKKMGFPKIHLVSVIFGNMGGRKR